MSDEDPVAASPPRAQERLVVDLFQESGHLLRPGTVSLKHELAKDRPDWEAIYHELPVDDLPWVSPGLDPDVAAWLEEHGGPAGKVLDLGTGAGTQALALAGRGLDVLGVDVSYSAIAAARERAGRAGAVVDFRVADVLGAALDASFDLMLDRGCLHGLPRADWPSYVEAVTGLLAPGGHLLLKCLSEAETRDIGPHRFAPHELRSLFESCFVVEAMQEARFEGSGPASEAPAALFCVLRYVST
jgi:SAM-dependent methyltransferase